MKKIDKHIYFTNEEYARISDYQEKNKLSFSEAVCSLSISALNGSDILDRIKYNFRTISHLYNDSSFFYGIHLRLCYF